MSTFDVLRISGSGLYANRKWMDAVSDNLANINTATSTDQAAFQERMIVVQAADYGSGQGGVQVAGAQFGSAEGRLVYEPENALAGAVLDGFGDDHPLLERVLVRAPHGVDVGDVVRDGVQPLAVGHQARAGDAEGVEDGHGQFVLSAVRMELYLPSSAFRASW